MGWLVSAFQSVLVDHALDAGLPVARVDPEYTTKQCHECQQFARLEGDVIECGNGGCPVDEVGRDLSAALSIAGRFEKTTP